MAKTMTSVGWWGHEMRPGRDRSQTRLTVRFNNSVPAGLPKKNRTRPHKDLYTSVHSSVTHESQELKRCKWSLAGQWMNTPST